MIRGHELDGKISKKEFFSKIKFLTAEDIEITSHALFRLNQKQRKIFEGDVLKKFILEKEPIEIGKQKNGNLSVLYNHEKERVLKIIMRFSSDKIYIVSFYILNIEQMKEINR